VRPEEAVPNFEGDGGGSVPETDFRFVGVVLNFDGDWELRGDSVEGKALESFLEGVAGVEGGLELGAVLVGGACSASGWSELPLTLGVSMEVAVG